jgi:chemotaxis protein methyltransferase CheR
MTNAMTDDEFEILRRILERAAGLVHDESRRDSLNFSVMTRIDATGVASVGDYLALLDGPSGAVERQQLVDAVTIQETHFFRNPPQIRALRQHVLPELVRRSVALERPLTIWSAGCSTGEEPYTLAMLIRELLPMATREHVRILGSDVSASALDFAATGQYGPRAVQMAESVDLARWFSVSGDSYVVRDDVRELVELRLHNLVTEPPPFEPGEVDLLLCRNVTIYFNRATTKALMGRFHSVLSDGGYLFLGHSETLWQMSDAFTLVPLGDAFVYRRDEEPERRAVLPERRTEAGDAPILLQERRGRGDRRRRPGGSSAGPSIALPRGSVLPAAWPQVGSQPPTASPGAPAGPIRPPAGESARSRRPAKPESGRRDPGRTGPTPDRNRTASASASDRARASSASASASDRTGTSGSASDHVAVARLALASGRYADAVVAAARAVRADPLLVDPHLVAGEALVNLGRDADAVKELRQAVYLQADCAPAHLLLAGALDRLGEPAAAGRAYRAAAATVGELPQEKVAAFFGGREAAELVELCIRLAMQAERAARNKGMTNGMMGGDQR